MMFQRALPAQALAGLLLLSGCNTYVDGSSGETYLKRYESQQTAASGGAAVPPLDPAIQKAAAVEPLLTFPARIGVAKIATGTYGGTHLTAMTPDEQGIWAAAAQELGADYGQFVPISPLVTEMARQIACDTGDCAKSIVEEIRIAAARQHLDAVLIYELATKTDRYDNPLWVTQLVLVGFFIAPSEQADVDGVGQAMLMDVRNGYVYGTTGVMVDDAATTVTTLALIEDRTRDAEDRAQFVTSAALAEKTVEMAKEVRFKLGGRELAAK